MIVRAALPFARIESDFRSILAPETDGSSPAEEGIRRIVQGWMEVIGPITVPALSDRLGIATRAIEAAMLALESGGIVLRGRFTPGTTADLVEWCDRRLLARIHRLTIGRLRREIEPVSAADFLRFLYRWQNIHPGSQLHGREGIVQVIGKLQGLELRAPAWERDVLPARVFRYNRSDLEQLCLSGVVAWGRLGLRGDAPEVGETPRRRLAPTRSASLGLVLREDLSHFLEPGTVGPENTAGLSSTARAVLRHLQACGACFLAEIAKGTGNLESQTEGALWELVARGLVTGDGIAGLRMLLEKGETKREPHRRFRTIRGGLARARHVPVGRWSLLRSPGDPSQSRGEDPGTNEAFARQLLRRYGVMFRDLLARETRAPSWRTLLGIYWRLEARGEIRGGRFVQGFTGEQFALPEAVESLRAIRNKRDGQEVILIAAADPLNLVGILTPGSRVSSLSSQAILYVDGVPVETGEAHALRTKLRQRQLS